MCINSTYQTFYHIQPKRKSARPYHFCSWLGQALSTIPTRIVYPPAEMLSIYERGGTLKLGDFMHNQPGNDYYLCPLAGLRKGDTIVIEGELISDYRLAEVVSTRYLKDNFHVQVVYRKDGTLGSFINDEFETVYLKRHEHIVPDDCEVQS